MISTLSMRQNPRYAFVRSRDTSYRLAVPAAILLLLVGVVVIPFRWVETLVPPRESPADTFDSPVGRPGEVRIIPIEIESAAPAPSPVAIEVVPEAEAAPTEPTSTVEARAQWTFDPTTAYRYGDDILRGLGPSLGDLLLAKQAAASPVLAMRHPDLSSTWDEQAHAGFALGHDIHRWGLSRTWAEEMRRRRMDAYWEKYILSDGDP